MKTSICEIHGSEPITWGNCLQNFPGGQHAKRYDLQRSKKDHRSSEKKILGIKASWALTEAQGAFNRGPHVLTEVHGNRGADFLVQCPCLHRVADDSHPPHPVRYKGLASELKMVLVGQSVQCQHVWVWRAQLPTCPGVK